MNPRTFEVMIKAAKRFEEEFLKSKHTVGGASTVGTSGAMAASAKVTYATLKQHVSPLVGVISTGTQYGASVQFGPGGAFQRILADACMLERMLFDQASLDGLPFEVVSERVATFGNSVSPMLTTSEVLRRIRDGEFAEEWGIFIGWMLEY